MPNAWDVFPYQPISTSLDRLLSIKPYKGCSVTGPSEWNPLVRATGILELKVMWGCLLSAAPPHRSERPRNLHFNEHQVILMQRANGLFFFLIRSPFKFIFKNILLWKSLKVHKKEQNKESHIWSFISSN